MHTKTEVKVKTTKMPYQTQVLLYWDVNRNTTMMHTGQVNERRYFVFNFKQHRTLLKIYFSTKTFIDFRVKLRVYIIYKGKSSNLKTQM